MNYKIDTKSNDGFKFDWYLKKSVEIIKLLELFTLCYKNMASPRY